MSVSSCYKGSFTPDAVRCVAVPCGAARLLPQLNVMHTAMHPVSMRRRAAPHRHTLRRTSMRRRTAPHLLQMNS